MPLACVACFHSVLLLFPLFNRKISVYVFQCVCVCLSRACRSSGRVSFKPPTSVNQNRNRILRPSSTFSSSTTPPVENRNTSVFPPRVSFLLLNRLKKSNVVTAQTHSSVLTLSDKDSQSVSFSVHSFHPHS